MYELERQLAHELSPTRISRFSIELPNDCSKLMRFMTSRCLVALCVNIWMGGLLRRMQILLYLLFLLTTC